MQHYPHGAKLIGRIKKERGKEKVLFEKIYETYNIFKEQCLEITSNNEEGLKQTIIYMNSYLNFFSGNEFEIIRKNFQGKIYPSILEEFMLYLFRSIVKPPLVCGSAKIPIGVHFRTYNDVMTCESYEESLCFDTTNADFVIGIIKHSKITNKEVIYPLVVIENKRYADKVMRGAVEDKARRVKNFAPECLYLLVLDLLIPFFEKNYFPNASAIDQIYGLRESAPNDHILRTDIVLKLFNDVENHINKIQKSISLKDRYERGYMMYR